MAHSTIVLEKFGLRKECPIGFSWTTLIFGFWPALFRGQVIMGLIMLILQICTLGLSVLIFPFIYNKLYLNFRLEGGYEFVSVSGKKGREEIEAELGIKLP